MTDDLPPDERDEELASLLEVPPLDDATRERIVTRALDNAATPRAARLRRLLLPAAAALVALVLVGVGVFALVNRDGDNGPARRAAGVVPDGSTAVPRARPRRQPGAERVRDRHPPGPARARAGPAAHR